MNYFTIYLIGAFMMGVYFTLSSLVNKQELHFGAAILVMLLWPVVLPMVIGEIIFNFINMKGRK